MAAPLSFALEALLVAGCRSRTLHGIRVGVLDRRQAEHSWRQVDQALETIGRFDPRRLRRLRSDVARILVVPTKQPAFSPTTRFCYLGQNAVTTLGAANVASRLVHEAVHARLRRKGLAAFGADLKVRVEELCIDEQIAFTQRWPREQFPNLDEHLHYLNGVRQTYPPTQAWPRRKGLPPTSPHAVDQQ